MSPIQDLARRQLEAYNAADLDAFCACYHPAVRVYEGEGLKVEGIEAFRALYVGKFGKGGFGATVDQRLGLGDHCVDRERYWVDGPDGRVEGELLVRYTLRDGLIGTVQFLR